MIVKRPELRPSEDMDSVVFGISTVDDVRVRLADLERKSNAVPQAEQPTK